MRATRNPSASCWKGVVLVAKRWELIQEAKRIFSMGRGRLDDSLGANLQAVRIIKAMRCEFQEERVS